MIVKHNNNIHTRKHGPTHSGGVPSFRARLIGRRYSRAPSLSLLLQWARLGAFTGNENRLGNGVHVSAEGGRCLTSRTN